MVTITRVCSVDLNCNRVLLLIVALVQILFLNNDNGILKQNISADKIMIE